MAVGQIIPADGAVARQPVTAAAPGQNAPAAAASEENQALLPVPQPAATQWEPLKGPETRLPVEVDVVVPVGEFRVRDLLALEPGKLIPSCWNYGEDVPLAAGAVQLAWSEFEVIDGQLGVRITRLP